MVYLWRPLWPFHCTDFFATPTQSPVSISGPVFLMLWWGFSLIQEKNKWIFRLRLSQLYMCVPTTLSVSVEVLANSDVWCDDFPRGFCVWCWHVFSLLLLLLPFLLLYYSLKHPIISTCQQCACQHPYIPQFSGFGEHFKNEYTNININFIAF